MHRTEYASATILHYDGRKKVGGRTCASLNGLGFRRIANLDNGRDMADLLRSRQFELVVFATEADNPGTVELIKRARRYDSALDPYTPMILVSWNGASEAVRKALNTGTDQLLMWPFSPEQLGARVDALISARKPFVETEDYLGPDRRAPRRGGTRSAAVQVPNALRAKVEGRPDLAPSAHAIKTARSNLERVKMANVTQRICVIAKVLRRHFGDPAFLDEWAAKELGAIETSLAVLRRALAGNEMCDKLAFCDSLEKAVTQLGHSGPDLDARGLALLERSARALRMAVAGDKYSAVGVAPAPAIGANKVK